MPVGHSERTPRREIRAGADPVPAPPLADALARGRAHEGLARLADLLAHPAPVA